MTKYPCGEVWPVVRRRSAVLEVFARGIDGHSAPLRDGLKYPAICHPISLFPRRQTLWLIGADSEPYQSRFWRDSVAVASRRRRARPGENGSAPECPDIFASENVGPAARTVIFASENVGSPGGKLDFCRSAEAKSAASNPQFPTGRKFGKKIFTEFPTGRKFDKISIDIV